MVNIISIIIAISDLTTTVLTIIIGAILIYKYKKYKYSPLIWWGIVVIATPFPLINEPINIILVSLSQLPLPAVYASLFYNAGTIVIVAWIIAWSQILNKEHFKIIALLSCIFGLFLTISFFIFWINTPYSLLIFIPPYTYNPGPWIQFNGLIMIIIFLSTATILWLDGRKSINREVRIKGSLFLVSATLAFLGMLSTIIFLTLVQSIFMIFAEIFLYISQVWPGWAKKIFISQE